MIRRHTVRAFAAITIAAAFGFASNAWSAPITTTTFSNNNPINIPGSGTAGQADPYPSSIFVSGLTDQVIVDVNVTLENLSHTFAGDISLVLEGPTGLTLLLWNDAGNFIEIVSIDVTFDDAAATEIGPMGPLMDGSYLVSQHGSVPIPEVTEPGPEFEKGGMMDRFDGSDPNGTWNLWAYDDKFSHTGLAVEGWSLTMQTAPVPEPSAALLFGLGSFIVGGTLRRRRA